MKSILWEKEEKDMTKNKKRTARLFIALNKNKMWNVALCFFKNQV